jgi:hypothetical protein
MAVVYLMACFQVMLHLALGLLANIYPSQPLHITRLLVGVPHRLAADLPSVLVR